MIRRLGACSWLVALCGCYDSIDFLDPQVGAALVERCSNVDSDPRTSVSFSRDVLPVLKKDKVPVGCNCHQPTDPNPLGIEQSGLDLSTYDSLFRGGNNSRGIAVIPGQPCSSGLILKISAGPPFGARMPFDGPPFLDDATRQRFSDWISEGALDN